MSLYTIGDLHLARGLDKPMDVFGQVWANHEEKLRAGFESLTEITIPEGVSVVGDNAFEDCTSLMKVMLPKSVSYIGDRAFLNCGSLTVTVPANSYAGEYCRENEIQYTVIP